MNLLLPKLFKLYPKNILLLPWPKVVENGNDRLLLVRIGTVASYVQDIVWVVTHSDFFVLNSLLNFVSSLKVCQLRERRLDLEEELAEEKKTSESLKKEYDALVKKAKVIDSALKTAEADLEAFQVKAIAGYIKYHEMENTLLWSAKPILPQFYEISNITPTVIV